MSDDAERVAPSPVSERIAAALARLERACARIEGRSLRHARLCDAVEAAILDLERLGAAREDDRG
jgi:hypothetical protein